MKSLDYFIQWLRIREAGKYIYPDSYLLDIGCADGAIFRQLDNKVVGGIGIDPGIKRSQDFGNFQLIRGFFPDAVGDWKEFDTITMLAVLEHIPLEEQKKIADQIVYYLKPNGRLIISVPSPFVDKILNLFRYMRLIDGMSLEEHYEFDIRLVPSIFGLGDLNLIKYKKFQFGLNNIFVFERITKKI